MNGEPSPGIPPLFSSPEPCALNPEPETLHPKPCPLHPKPCTLHPQPSTLHPNPLCGVQGLNPNPNPLTLNPAPGFPAVAMDGVSSFLTADAAVSGTASRNYGTPGGGPFGSFSGNSTVTYLHQANCSSRGDPFSGTISGTSCFAGYEPPDGDRSAAANEAAWLGRAAHVPHDHVPPEARTSLTILSVVRARAPPVLAAGKVARARERERKKE